MAKTALREALDYVDATREKRTQMANRALANPNLIGPLLEITFEGRDPISNRAAWVLEFVLNRNLSLIVPHLDTLVDGLPGLRMDSSIRPMAKICEFLTKAYFIDKDMGLRGSLTDTHLEIIASASFDWLIGEYKVASKAYSMTSLFLLGTRLKWIHPELKLVLENSYASGSAAYRARARMTLEKLDGLG